MAFSFAKLYSSIWEFSVSRVVGQKTFKTVETTLR